VIEMRRAQLSFGEGLIAEEVSDLREEWMTHAVEILGDEEIVAAVYEALAERHPKSRSRGRPTAPAEMVLRLLVLKHIRNWSYQVLERDVRANLVYRDFTKVGAGKMPDAKTVGRWGVAAGPEVIKQVHARLVKIAQEEDVVPGRRMRVDTTVVETNIHYPTDSSLMGDGVSGAEAGDEEDHQDRRRGRHRIARPQPERETARARYCPGSTRQGPAELGQA
jgi:IS5 family transposase